MLILLYHLGDRTVTEMADTLPIDQGAISRLAGRLERKGLLERRASPEDRRATLLCLTPQGQRLTPRLAAEADAIEEEYFGVLSDKEARQFKTLLSKVMKGVGFSPDPKWAQRPVQRPGRKQKRRRNGNPCDQTIGVAG